MISVQPMHAEVIMYLVALPVAETVHASGTLTLTGVVQNCLQAHGGRVVQSSLEPPGVLIRFLEPVHALQAAVALRDVYHGPQKVDPRPDCVILDAHDRTGGAPAWADLVNHLRSVAQPGMIFISVDALRLLRTLPDGFTLTPVQFSADSEETAPQFFEVRTDRSQQVRAPGRAPITGMLAQLSTFVGRETEVKQIKALLFSKRLVTISGPGGSGKTRLSLLMAEEIRASFPDGVAIADLTPISDPSIVTHTLATALGLREAPGTPVESAIIKHLSSRTALIILDNCEHLIEACAQLTANILRSCSGITILATSREPLGVYGETIWRLAPLPVPHPDQARQADDLMRFAATRLFVERAASAHSTFRVPDAQVRVVAEICRRLDGMPLAIELAAAQVKFLSVEQLSDRLHDAFRLLVTRSRTAHARQQTLRLTMDWSYDLLTEEEQSLLRRLAVFSGGASLEAIEAVCAGSNVEAESILGLLAQLVDKSLVMVEAQPDESRFYLLEVVRQYGLMRMGQFQEEQELRRRHFEWVHALVQRAHPHLDGPEHTLWLSRLEQDQDNLRAALSWCQTGTLLPDEKVSLVVPLLRFWYVRGLFSEGLAHFAAVLDASPDCSPGLRAEVLRGMGILAALLGDAARAENLFESSYAIFSDLGDQRKVCLVLQNMGQFAAQQGRFDRADQLFERCLAIAQTIGDQRVTAYATVSLGRLAYRQQDYERARTLIEEGLQQYGERQDVLVTQSVNILGDIYRELKEYKSAYRLYREALSNWVELGNADFLASCLEAIATLLERCGSRAEAVQLLGHCHASRLESGCPMSDIDRPTYDSTVANLKQRMGESTFLRLWENGQQLGLEHWVSWLQRPETAQDIEQAAAGEWLTPVPKAGRLTDREREIAELVSKGLTDKEIGKILNISSRTVDGHMRSTFAKVNVTSRAALAAWTVEQRLGGA